MYTLDVASEFAAAHQLAGSAGKCENLHGHNWRVQLTVAGEKLNETGMLVDFSELKRMLNAATGELDHRFLNDLPAFAHDNPTSECLAKHLADTLAPKMPGGVRVKAVTVWESTTCSATYRPQDGPA